VVVATAVAATAVAAVVATAVAAIVVIAVQEPVAGRIAATEPETTQAVAVIPMPILMRMVAAVADVAPPPAVEMTIPAMEARKAEFSSSEAGLSQLATGLLQYVQIRIAFLSFFAQVPAPMSGSWHPLH